MEILEAFDLAGTLRGAAELAGCDHKTVAYWVRARDDAGGGLPVAVRPRPRVDAFAEKIEDRVDRSRGKVRADVAHQRLAAIGYLGSERTTRRAVAEAKRRWRAEHGRRTRPWITEPGLWMQWDYGDGPVVAGRSTVLFCAWLAWSRFRVVVPLWDRTMPSVVVGLDRALRRFGGAPTYVLTITSGRSRPTRCVGSRCATRGSSRSAAITGCRSRPASRPIQRARAARRRRSGSRGPIWCRPSTTCAANTRTSRRSRRRALSSAIASTRATTGSRAGRRR
jgi:hypothetical protein